MIDKVLEFAREDDRVRWVLLTGSRANKLIEPDEYQDYDIQLGVNDLDSFLISDAWLSVFGECVIMQKPEAMAMFPPSLGGRFTYLMQFVDGSRLDLMLVPLDLSFPLDSISLVLLDKDSLIDLSSARELVYWRSEVNVLECMNEFLWLSYYVVKGFKRTQIIYAMDHLNIMREMALQMWAWKLGGNPGLSFKYLESKLDPSVLSLIYKSYDVNDIMGSMMNLFLVMEEGAREFEYDKSQFESVRSSHQKTMV